MGSRAELESLVAEELKHPVAPAVAAMADAVRARHPQGALAVLFYGSCLRRPETLLGDSLLDFYLLVEDYASAYGSGLLAIANKCPMYRTLRSEIRIDSLVVE